MTPDRVDKAMFAWPLDGPYDPDRTVDAARTIAELVRYLTTATGPWKSGDCLQWPDDLGRVVASLRGALHGLDQLLQQLGQHCDRFADMPGLYDDRGGDPQATAGDAAGALEAARAGVRDAADALGRAHEAANRLGIRDQPPDLEGEPRCPT